MSKIIRHSLYIAIVSLVLHNNTGDCKVKIWHWTNDIFDVQNHQTTNTCKNNNNSMRKQFDQVEFAVRNSAPIFLDESITVTDSILLPLDGAIYLSDNTGIEFIPKALKSTVPCDVVLKLKPINSHNWYDPKNWRLDENNDAVPPLERLPCWYDDVVLVGTVRKPSTGQKWTVNSLQYKNQTKFRDENTFRDFALNTFLGRGIFPFGTEEIQVVPGECKDPMGCQCQRFQFECHTNNKKEPIQCLRPIQPFGFCTKTCGAFITLSPPTSERNLTQLNQLLTEHTKDVGTVDFYVMRTNPTTLQITIFDRGNYTGQCIETARNIYRTLLNDKNSFYVSIELTVSGDTLQLSSTLTNNDSHLSLLMFLTFIVVILVFVIIFHTNGYYIHLPLSKKYMNTCSATRQMAQFFRIQYHHQNNDNDNEELVINHPKRISDEETFANPLYEMDLRKNNQSDLNFGGGSTSGTIHKDQKEIDEEISTSIELINI